MIVLRSFSCLTNNMSLVEVGNEQEVLHRMTQRQILDDAKYDFVQGDNFDFDIILNENGVKQLVDDGYIKEEE